MHSPLADYKVARHQHTYEHYSETKHLVDQLYIYNTEETHVLFPKGITFLKSI